MEFLAATSEINYQKLYSKLAKGQRFEYLTNRKWFKNTVKKNDTLFLRVQGDNHVRIEIEISSVIFAPKTHKHQPKGKAKLFLLKGKIIDETLDVNTRDIFLDHSIKAGAEYGRFR